MFLDKGVVCYLQFDKLPGVTILAWTEEWLLQRRPKG